jgi:hypothetical protein
MLLIGLIACKQKDKKVDVSPNVDSPLLVANHQTQFDSIFTNFLQQYYDILNALYNQQLNNANAAGENMIIASDSLPFNLLKADSIIIETAKENVTGIQADLKGMVAETSLQEKLKDFATISQALYDLVRTVQYSKAPVYHFHCYKAFNNAGADWLSNSTTIQNPYLHGSKIVCGTLVDSLKFNQ